MSNSNTKYYPWNFPDVLKSDEITVEYSDIKEVGQGSPLVGKLSINGQSLPSGYDFGGPALIGSKAVFVPRFVQKKRMFELCKINPETRAIKTLITPLHIIWPDKIENGILYFYSDMNRTALSQYDLTSGNLQLAEPNTTEKENPFHWFGILLFPFVLIFSVAVMFFTLIGSGIVKIIGREKTRNNRGDRT